MIRGGDHVEWPRDYFYDTAYDKEAEMEMDREYEEAMWGHTIYANYPDFPIRVERIAEYTEADIPQLLAKIGNLEDSLLESHAIRCERD